MGRSTRLAPKEPVFYLIPRLGDGWTVWRVERGGSPQRPSVCYVASHERHGETREALSIPEALQCAAQLEVYALPPAPRLSRAAQQLKRLRLLGAQGSRYSVLYPRFVADLRDPAFDLPNCTYNDIARRYGISRRTVQVYLARALAEGHIERVSTMRYPRYRVRKEHLQ